MSRGNPPASSQSKSRLGQRMPAVGDWSIAKKLRGYGGERDGGRPIVPRFLADSRRCIKMPAINA